jgi:hypothetical protein
LLSVFPDAAYYAFVGRDDFYDLLDADAGGSNASFDDRLVQEAVTISKGYCVSDAKVVTACLEVLEDIGIPLTKVLLKTQDLIGSVVSDVNVTSSPSSIGDRMRDMVTLGEMSDSLSKGCLAIGASIYPESLDVGDDEQGLEMIISQYFQLIGDTISSLREMMTSVIMFTDLKDLNVDSGSISSEVDAISDKLGGRLKAIAAYIEKSRSMQLSDEW